MPQEGRLATLVPKCLKTYSRRHHFVLDLAVTTPQKLDISIEVWIFRGSEGVQHVEGNFENIDQFFVLGE